MKGFVEDPDFLLGTGTAVELYHGWAERMPIATATLTPRISGRIDTLRIFPKCG